MDEAEVEHSRASEGRTHDERAPGGLRVALHDNVAVLTIDSQQVRNALSPELERELVGAMLELDADRSIRVIVLTGAGDRAFCSGIDLSADPHGSRSVEASHPLRRPMAHLFEVVLETTTPTIAAINGDAVGGGLELALACDIRIASSTARMGLPEARRGFGATFGAQLLPRIVPRGIAFEMLYSGELIDADTAERIGLVNATTAGSALDRALERAAVVARNAPLATRRIKAAVLAGADLPLSAAVRMNIWPNPYVSSDLREGLAAFRDRRDPEWTGT